MSESAWRTLAAAGVCVAMACAASAQSRDTPDGPCAFEDERFVDCGNGTVTDVATGLIWLQYADCLMDVPVNDATGVVARLADGQCGLFDGSAPGDWRLPTREEWLVTVSSVLDLGCRAALEGLMPSMRDRSWDECFQQLEQAHDTNATFASVFSPVYLASLTPDANPTVATITFVGYGDTNFIGTFGQGFELRLWAVRGSR